jgi:N-methylhydantoinase A
MQMFEVSTPVPPGPIDQDVVEGVMTAFEDRYAALYGRGTGFREAGLQAITYRVYGLGELPFKPVLPTIAQAKTPHPPIQNRRRALLDVRTGWQDVAIYNYAVLAAGHEFDGPAIVEAPTTTVVVPQGAKATVDLLGNLVMNYS